MLSTCTEFIVDETIRCNIDEHLSLANQESQIGINSGLQKAASHSVTHQFYYSINCAYVR